mmetsp:Transcript_8812/g.17432  ORF Transcript_8812/g.17432 Transcript_8812/m.17432 type:complete len:492 (+) Transcript_8812:324-1799(+)
MKKKGGLCAAATHLEQQGILDNIPSPTTLRNAMQCDACEVPATGLTRYTETEDWNLGLLATAADVVLDELLKARLIVLGTLELDVDKGPHNKVVAKVHEEVHASGLRVPSKENAHEEPELVIKTAAAGDVVNNAVNRLAILFGVPGTEHTSLEEFTPTVRPNTSTDKDKKDHSSTEEELDSELATTLVKKDTASTTDDDTKESRDRQGLGRVGRSNTDKEDDSFETFTDDSSKGKEEHKLSSDLTLNVGAILMIELIENEAVSAGDLLNGNFLSHDDAVSGLTAASGAVAKGGGLLGSSNTVGLLKSGANSGSVNVGKESSIVAVSRFNILELGIHGGVTLAAKTFLLGLFSLDLGKDLGLDTVLDSVNVTNRKSNNGDENSGDDTNGALGELLLVTLEESILCIVNEKNDKDGASDGEEECRAYADPYPFLEVGHADTAEKTEKDTNDDSGLQGFTEGDEKGRNGEEADALAILERCNFNVAHGGFLCVL